MEQKFFSNQTDQYQWPNQLPKSMFTQVKTASSFGLSQDIRFDNGNNKREIEAVIILRMTSISICFQSASKTFYTHNFIKLHFMDFLLWYLIGASMTIACARSLSRRVK